MTQTSKFQNGHALVIAIADYQYINSLPDAVLNDADDLVSVLTAHNGCRFDPGNVRRLTNEKATRSAILAALQELSVKAKLDDTVCIYFTGHGALVDDDADASESMLLPADCDMADLLATSISSTELSAALNSIPARRLVVFIDACHAAGAAILKQAGAKHAVKLGYSESSLDLLAHGVGRTLMASSRPSETSLIMPGDRNSAFTSVLLDGLRGGAATAEGEVRVFDLFSYISEGVPVKTVGEQHPVFKAAQVEQNFCVALYHGKTKQPEVVARTGSSGEDITTHLTALMSNLYPSGPTDQELWVRAGGDIAVLRLQGTGRAQWFSAIRTLKLGGGGTGITFESLVSKALEDFANNEELRELQRRV
ncbi:caspase family protein [Paraburkholderia sp. BR14263]|uniref:caspase family protein n=1 Tax=unclassified Paraburkholderia TaxID=2615204 RepID=UPI0034D01325